MDRLQVLHIHGGRVKCGVATHIISLMREIPRYGIEPFLILLHDGEVAAEARQLRLHFEVVGRGHKRSPALLLSLRRWMRSRRFDLIHTHTLNGNLYGRLAAWLPPVLPVITSIHTDMDVILEDVFRQAVWRRVLIWQDQLFDRYARALIVPSSDMKARLVRKGLPAERLHVIPNGIRLGEWRYSPTDRRLIRGQLGIPERAFVLGFVGRLVSVKQPQKLVTLMTELEARNRAPWLVIVGDGPEKERLMALARTAGVGNRMRFMGYRRDVPAIMSAIDLYVHTSREESFGYSVVEAMAARRPVVAFESGSLPEIIQDRVTGRLAAPDDAAAMVGAIIDIMDNPTLGLTMGEAASSRCEAKFSAAVMAERTAAIYRNAVAFQQRDIANGD